ncbi:tetratricopeptide repeat protein [Planctomycetes bacterium K23_9]|uniref:Tetratricopeptide repeat protein n=1 Tax=Stieleria marina TaxID=1930275 RepID=A0A517NV08_9BACT|nr:Tetratricopeptide repeat protein [Planctomycetes bacterium K23_9]
MRPFHHFIRVLLLCFTLNAAQSVVAEVITHADENWETEFQDAGSNQLIEPIRKMVSLGQIDQARYAIARVFENTANASHSEIVLAQLAFNEGKRLRAKKILESLSGKHPNRLDVQLAFSQLAMAEQRWFDAYGIASRGAAAVTPTTWDEAHAASVQHRLTMIMAKSCEHRQAWEEAGSIYLEAARRSEPTADVLAGLGRCHFHNGEVAKSVLAFRELRKLVVNAEFPELSVAKLFQAAGEHEQAKKFFRIAVAKSDGRDRELSLIAYARFCIWNNRPEVAAKAIESLSDVATGEREVQFLLALIARMESRFSDARTILEQLQRSHPNSMPIKNQLALVLIESENKDDRAFARLIAEANTRAHSAVAETWSTLGWIQYRLGELQLAEETLKHSMKSGTGPRDVAHYLAKVYEGLGNNEAAMAFAKARNVAEGPTFYANTNFETNEN